MKVLHVIPSVGPLRGGPSVTLHTMARTLIEAGISVDVATTDDNGPDRLNVTNGKPMTEDGVTYHYFPRQTRFYTFSWPLTRWLARHVNAYDVVHIHALFSYASLPAAYWARRYNVPYIVRPLGVLNQWGMENRRPWLKNLSFSLIEMRILNGAAAVHFTSEEERLQAAALGIEKKAVVIPNPTDTPSSCGNRARGQFRNKYRLLDNRFVILFLSRVDPKKGLDILVPAFAALRARYPETVLVIAGNGDQDFVSRLHREATALGIASDVIWTGFLSGEEKWAAMRDADLFVLPSYSENFGVAVVEAMAAGLPVVVSDQVAIHREISEAHAGIIVPCDTQHLLNALVKLLADADLRVEMGNNGRTLARKQFSAEITTERLMALYREIKTRTSATACTAEIPVSRPMS